MSEIFLYQETLHFLECFAIAIPDLNELHLFYRFTSEWIDEFEIDPQSIQQKFPELSVFLWNLNEPEGQEQWCTCFTRSTPIYHWNLMNLKGRELHQALRQNQIQFPKYIHLINLASINDKLKEKTLEEIFAGFDLPFQRIRPSFDQSPDQFPMQAVQLLSIAGRFAALLPSVLNHAEIQESLHAKSEICKQYSNLRLTPDMTSASMMACILEQDHPGDDSAVHLSYPLATVPFEPPKLHYLPDYVMNRAQSLYRGAASPETLSDVRRITQMMHALENVNLNPCIPSTPPAPQSIPAITEAIAFRDSTGNLNGTYAIFSRSRIQGGVFNLELYERDLELCSRQIQNQNDFLTKAKELLQIDQPTPEQILSLTAPVILSDGTSHTASEFISSENDQPAIRTFPQPELFIKKDIYELNDRYRITYACPVVHCDFKSYFPNLLINMNALGTTGTYPSIYQSKKAIDEQMADASVEQKKLLKTKRQSVKLLLNAAYGACDAPNAYPNIFLRNKIQSMRLIGQMLLFLIILDLASEGIRSVSINTDGIYCEGDPKKIENILSYYAALIQIEIDSEPMHLIFKSINDRMELDPSCKKIIGSSGSDLKQLNDSTSARPQIPLIVSKTFAWFLCTLCRKQLPLNNELTQEQARSMLEFIASTLPSSKEKLRAFAWIIRTNKDKYPAILFRDSNSGRRNMALSLCSTNRIFFLQPGFNELPAGPIVFAGKHSISEAKRNHRVACGETAQQNNLLGASILRDNRIMLEKNEEAALEKHAGFPEYNFCCIDNRSIDEITNPDLILQHLDLNVYADLLIHTWNKWRNTE